MDKYVTVAGFTALVQAEIARGRLVSEGIPAVVTGSLTSSSLFGLSDLGGRVELCVPAGDVPRAIQILSVCGDAENLTDEARGGWADEGPVWVCSLCGDTVRAVLPLCPACHTPRGRVPDFDPEDDSDDESEAGIQEFPTGGTRPTGVRSDEGLKVPEEVTAAAPASAPRPESDAATALEIPPLETMFGDARARQALHAALFGLLVPVGAFTVYSMWIIVTLANSGGSLSARGRRDRSLALFFNGLFCLFVVLLCAG